MAAAGRGHGWGAIWRHRAGIKAISLPVAQIRVIYKNGPQVSIEDIKFKHLPLPDYKYN
jgi:hypothetical protein